LFADDDGGGFFTTGTDAEPLIVRPKDVEDNATPSENSLAAHALLRLAELTGDDRARERAARWVAGVAPVLGEHPTAFAYLLRAFGRVVRPPVEVVIVGEAADPGRAALVDVTRSRLLPWAVRVVAEPGRGDDRSPGDASGLGVSRLLAGRGLVDGRATAYVCESYACDLPVTDAEELAARLDALRPPR
jgi:uncharacterized protein YyaL (SSP411 family)